MLAVGVAIRLGKRPADVLRWSAWEVAAVAAYCQLEQEDFEKSTPSARSRGAPQTGASGARTVTQSFKYVVGRKKE